MAQKKQEINIQITEMNSKKPNSAATINTDDEERLSKFEKAIIILEIIAFVCIFGVLIASLANHKLQNKKIWDTEIWKWSLLAMAILCGRLVGYLITECLMFFVWRANWVDEKILYFAYGIKKSILIFIWVSWVTITWALLFNRGVKRSKHDKKIAHHITKCLLGFVIGAAIWLVKNLFVKAVGSVHAKKLFNKIKYIITFRTTLLDISRGVGVEDSGSSGDYSRMHILKELINSIRGQKLKSFSYHHSESCKEIRNAREAREAADVIFVNLGAKYIEEEDGDEVGEELRSTAQHGSKKPKCYLKLEELSKCVKEERIRKHFEEELAEVKRIRGNENEAQIEKHIKRSSFRQWLVDVYKEYDSLNNTLVHTKMAIEDFDKIASIAAMVVIFIVWMIFMDYLSVKALVFLSSQFVLLGFIFGNTMKTLFEAIIFVFFIHPFDVGDRCIVDNVEMIVDEMRMLSTKFLKGNGEKLYYPNAVLLAKPISNLYRSPPMGDAIEFAIDLSTPFFVLDQLKERIKLYLASNPRRWKEDHSVLFQEIEDVNKLKVTLGFGHTVNFHYASKRAKRRSLLVLEVKKILEDLQIKYHLLPREVHLKYI